jgi:hypothetical protein
MNYLCFFFFLENDVNLHLDLKANMDEVEDMNESLLHVDLNASTTSNQASNEIESIDSD